LIIILFDFLTRGRGEDRELRKFLDERREEGRKTEGAVSEKEEEAKEGEGDREYQREGKEREGKGEGRKRCKEDATVGKEEGGTASEMKFVQIFFALIMYVNENADCTNNAFFLRETLGNCFSWEHEEGGSFILF
jgi:hypothetical protein